VAEKIKDYSKAEVLVKIANIIIQQMELDTALVVAEKIEDEDDKVKVLEQIIEALAKLNEKNKAIEIANRVLTVAVTIKDENSKSNMLGRVGETMAHLWQPEQKLFIMRKDLVMAQKAGLHEVLNKIGNWAPFIAFIEPEGQILWKIYEAITEIDGWWSKN